MENHIDEHIDLSGDFDNVLVIRQAAGKIRGTIDMFGSIAIEGSLTVSIADGHCTMTGELTAFAPVADERRTQLLEIIDRASYSLKEEFGGIIKNLTFTLTQTCEAIPA